VSVVVRTATVLDVDAVLDLWKVATGPSSTDDAPALVLLLDFAPQSLLVACDDSEIVGTVIVAWDGWRGAMHRLAVAATHRRRGIASLLVREGERRLRALGARRFQMIVTAGNTVGRAFWEAAGYELTEQVRYVKTFS
jgi:ribosomal protein S18 acetylase RimI-like enzyme